MVSITHLFGKDNRISAGDRVQCMYRGLSYVGLVLGAEHSKNRYTVKIMHRRHSEVYASRKRHELTPVNDLEFQDTITDVNYMSEAYGVENSINLIMN